MTLVIEVEYLTGCAMATDRELRNKPEWPPHPQRLFSSLVAAYKECDFGEAERAALDWLEGLAPPQLRFSEAPPRDPAPVYVPVNDVSTPDSAPKDIGNALKVLPERRTRQERFFPTVVPESRPVHFVWTDAAEEDLSTHRPALERLAAEVGYLGHSRSLVRMTVIDVPPAPPTLVPVSQSDETATFRLRTVGRGRLSLLERLYEQSMEGLRRIEAPDVPWTGYRYLQERQQTHRSVFGDTRDWFVFKRIEGRSLPLEACLALTSSVWRAVCEQSDDSVAGILCGHEADGTPTDKPHVAFLPLAHVGHRHADGEILGFAVVLPRDVPLSMRQSILLGLGRLNKIWHNQAATNRQHLAFDWQVEMVTGEEPRKTLHPRTYLRPSRSWATVTPVVFGHFLRKLDDARTKKIVKECCTAIGLPEPERVSVAPVSRLPGVPHSRAFPSLSGHGKPVWTTFTKGRHELPRKLSNGAAVRMRYHVALDFAEPVRGPVILGAGRYFGMGLCRPIPWAKSAEERSS